MTQFGHRGITASHYPLFDHLIGESEEVGLDGEAERSGGLSVDDELERGRLLGRELADLCAAKVLVDRACHLAINALRAWPVGHQAPGVDRLASAVDRRQPALGSECHDTR